MLETTDENIIMTEAQAGCALSSVRNGPELYRALYRVLVYCVDQRAICADTWITMRLIIGRDTRKLW